jgi:RimJ/RimL family protein N-acetyltransferase
VAKGTRRPSGRIPPGQGADRPPAARPFGAGVSERHVELAVAVADDFQGDGLGTAITDLVLAVAEDNGLEAVVAEVRNDNRPMSHVLGKLGFPRPGRVCGATTFVRPPPRRRQPDAASAVRRRPLIRRSTGKPST